MSSTKSRLLDQIYLTCLARGDESTNWRWVPVLEEAQAQATGGAGLVADRLAGGTRTRGDNVAVTCSSVANRANGLAVSGALVGGRGGGLSRALAESKAARTGSGEGGGLELALLWPKEHERALLASVGLRNIELEDSAVLLVDACIVLGPV